MTKKNGSKKHDAKRREQFQKNLSEVFQLASFADDKVDAEKKDERTELDVTEKKDLDDKNNSTEKIIPSVEPQRWKLAKLDRVLMVPSSMMLDFGLSLNHLRSFGTNITWKQIIDERIY